MTKVNEFSPKLPLAHIYAISMIIGFSPAFIPNMNEIGLDFDIGHTLNITITIICVSLMQ